MADASAVVSQLEDRWTGDIVARQFAFADVIVLNKCDLVADVASVAARVAALRPGARMMRVAHAEVPDDALSFAVAERSRGSRLQVDAAHDFPTFLLPANRVFDRDRLRAVLGDLPRSVLRVKGVCLLGAEGTPTLLQYAAERWAFTAAPAGLVPGLVVIGTPELPPREVLLAMFATALA